MDGETSQLSESTRAQSANHVSCNSSPIDCLLEAATNDSSISRSSPFTDPSSPLVHLGNQRDGPAVMMLESISSRVSPIEQAQSQLTSSPFEPIDAASSSIQYSINESSVSDFASSFNSHVESTLQSHFLPITDSNSYSQTVYPEEMCPNSFQGFQSLNGNSSMAFSNTYGLQQVNNHSNFVPQITENANSSPTFAILESANVADNPPCYGIIPQASQSLSSTSSCSNPTMFEFGQNLTSQMQYSDQGNIMHPDQGGIMHPGDSALNASCQQSLSSNQPQGSGTSLKRKSTSSNSTKPKRRRKINKDQRSAANHRERKRMVTLNQAFEELQERIPTFSYEKKLSRIETLKLAIGYIWFMQEVLNGTYPEHINLSYFIDSLPLLGHKIDNLYNQIYSK